MALILTGVVMLCLAVIIRKALAPVRELTEFAAQIPCAWATK